MENCSYDKNVIQNEPFLKSRTCKFKGKVYKKFLNIKKKGFVILEHLIVWKSLWCFECDYRF